MKSVVVIRHIMFEDLGSLHDVMKEDCYDIQFVEAGIDSIAHINNKSPDLLVILGGPISVNDTDDYPWLIDEIELIKNRIKLARPIIGICLGAQLIAKACGEKVYPGPNKEIGWGCIDIVGAGETHPIRLLKNIPILHWHGETFDLPRSASLIASSGLYKNQAFIIGNYCLGLQFHAEVKQKKLEAWFIGHTGEINQTNGISIRSIRADTKEKAPILEPIARQFWRDVLSYMKVGEESKV